MPRESAYDKGSRLLTEARLIVLEATRYGFVCSVRGEGHLYRTAYQFGAWSCTCEARRPTCSHIAAAKRISAIDRKEPPMTTNHRDPGATRQRDQQPRNSTLCHPPARARPLNQTAPTRKAMR